MIFNSDNPIVNAIEAILMGLLVNVTYHTLAGSFKRFSRNTDMKGIWLERMEDNEERTCSIGIFRYNWMQRKWLFDGVNYNADGSIFCEWKTHHSYIDQKQGKYYYIFSNTQAGSRNMAYEGFGSIKLEHDGKKLTPVSGAFAAGNPGETFRSHTMERISYHKIPRSQKEALRIIEKHCKNKPT